MRRDSLLWNFTVLGEAASAVSVETRGRFPDIPWRTPARLRNRIVHGYWSVDIGILHTTANVNLGELVKLLLGVLAALAGDDDPDWALKL